MNQRAPSAAIVDSRTGNTIKDQGVDRMFVQKQTARGPLYDDADTIDTRTKEPK